MVRKRIVGAVFPQFQYNLLYKAFFSSINLLISSSLLDLCMVLQFIWALPFEKAGQGYSAVSLRFTTRMPPTNAIQNLQLYL
jgi:hypothetical protein